MARLREEQEARTAKKRAKRQKKKNRSGKKPTGNGAHPQGEDDEEDNNDEAADGSEGEGGESGPEKESAEQDTRAASEHRRDVPQEFAKNLRADRLPHELSKGEANEFQPSFNVPAKKIENVKIIEDDDF